MSTVTKDVSLDDGQGDSDEMSASSVNFAGETGLATFAKFTMALSGFVGTILFARWLGPAEFGGFYLLMSVLRLVDRPIGGWSRAGKKRFAEVDSEQREIFGAMIGLAALWNTIAIAVAWIFAPYLRSYTGLSSAPVMFAALLVALSTLPLLALVESKGKISVSKWIDTLRSYVTLGLQIVFVSLGFGAAGMAFGLSAATFLTVPLGLVYLRTWPIVPSRETLCSIWSFARYSIPRSYIGQGYKQFDILLLGFLLVPGVVADYEIAARLTLPATFVASTASSLLMPRVSELSSTNRDISTDISNALAFSSIIAIPLFFGAVALPTEVVVTVYGSQYRDAGILLIGLAAYRFVETQTEPLLQTLDGLDLPDVNLRISTLALAVNIPLGVFLVLEIGPIGAVLATIAAECIRYGGSVMVLNGRVEGVRFASPALLKQVGMGLVMFVVVVVVHQFVPVQAWNDLLLLVSTGAAVYALGLFLVSVEVRYTTLGMVEGTAFESHLRPIVMMFEKNR